MVPTSFVVMPSLMPNHIHLVVRREGDGDIARWMQWLFTTHACHYHEKYGTTGHVWQGRYKHFPVQGDHHLLTLAAIGKGPSAPTTGCRALQAQTNCSKR